MNDEEKTQPVVAGSTTVSVSAQEVAPSQPSQSLFVGGDATTHADAFTDPAPDEFLSAAAEPLITWRAAEFIAHDKSVKWYFLLMLAIAAIAGLSLLVTRDPVSPGVIIICGVLFGIYAGHKPRELEYSLDSVGLSIASKHYPFSGFRSFTVFHEPTVTGVTLLPLRRFAPSLTLYFDPEDEQPISNILSEHLPLDNRKRDSVDRLMRRIGF